MNVNPTEAFADRLKHRVYIYGGLLIILLLYTMICIVIGLGDSRKMNNLSNAVSDIIIFGGAIYLIAKIRYYKKAISNIAKANIIYQRESSEKFQYLYDKSGGLAIRILILILLFITCTFALYNVTAFYVSFIILLLTILLKFLCYRFYSKSFDSFN